MTHCGATRNPWTWPAPTTTRPVAAGNTSSMSSTRGPGTSARLRHYQRAIGHHEATGNLYGAGQARFNVALFLAGNGRKSEALPYARAALDNFLKTGPGGASQAAVAERLCQSLAGNDGVLTEVAGRPAV